MKIAIRNGRVVDPASGRDELTFNFHGWRWLV